MSAPVDRTRVVCLALRPDGEPVPGDFTIAELPLPPPAPGQVLVRNFYLSVDPNMRGRLEPTEKHYTHNFVPGEPLDGRALGQVVRSRATAVPVGAYVRHHLGFRDYSVVDAEATSRVDPRLAPLPTWLGLLGQTGFTAYVGLRRIGALAPGDTVLISAAGGAVGSAAGQFARLLGAKQVIGSAGGAGKCRVLVDELGFDAAVDYRAERLRDGLARLAPDGIDLYFDNVGGQQLVDALYALSVGGRVALCGMMSQFDARTPAPTVHHLIQAVLKRLTLRGFIVRDHEDLRPEFEARVAGWLRAGEVVGKETIVDGLERAVEAFLTMLRGGNVGKMLVRLPAADL